MRNHHEFIDCAWRPFKQEVLLQWRKLDEDDLQEAGRNRRSLARIIERKYGVAWQLAETYLSHLEQTLERRPYAA
jgi:hypothetical protein